MDEDIIEDIAQTLAEQLNEIQNYDSFNRGAYMAQCYDDIVAMAMVVNRHQPTYDLRYFYKQTGYPEPYPVHPIH